MTNTLSRVLGTKRPHCTRLYSDQWLHKQKTHIGIWAFDSFEYWWNAEADAFCGHCVDIWRHSLCQTRCCSCVHMWLPRGFHGSKKCKERNKTKNGTSDYLFALVHKSWNYGSEKVSRMVYLHIINQEVVLACGYTNMCGEKHGSNVDVDHRQWITILIRMFLQRRGE